jgi:Domain of unknown function (DUF4855)
MKYFFQKRIIPWTVLLIILLSATVSRADYFPLIQKNQPYPADLMLIYQGGFHRPQWTINYFAPYVTYLDAQGGNEQWLYDGFLIIEFQDGRHHTYEQYSNLKPAQKQQWITLLERNFAANDGVPNLEKTVEAAITRIGPPLRRRQVYLTLPVPMPGQTNWGDLDGRPLDFNKREDRLAACEWYMDAALKQWQELAPKQLDLAGFYWVAEQYPGTNSFLPEVAQQVHARGKQFIWIPSFHINRPLGDWKSFGFDEACLQPNYFFHPELSPSRLQLACDYARDHDMGLEMEFDFRTMTNSAVYEPRLHAYLDAFIKNGVQDGAVMGWYEGGGALHKLAISDNPQMRADYDEVAQFVLKRQHAVDEKFKEGQTQAGK